MENNSVQIYYTAAQVVNMQTFSPREQIRLNLTQDSTVLVMITESYISFNSELHSNPAHTCVRTHTHTLLSVAINFRHVVSKVSLFHFQRKCSVKEISYLTIRRS